MNPERSGTLAPRLWLPPMLCSAVCGLVLAAHWNLPWFEAWRRLGLPLGATFWSAATLVGDALVTPLLIVPFLPGRPRLAWQGALAALLAAAFTHLLKPLFDLPRPPAVLDGVAVIGPRLMAGSFPSGHTTSAFTVCGLLVLCGALRGVVPVVLAATAATLVGLSRVMVGAHWPADVLGGAAGGWACAALALALAQRWSWGEGTPARAALQGLLALMALYDLLGHDTGYPAGLFLQRAVAVLALAGLAWPFLRRRSRPT